MAYGLAGTLKFNPMTDTLTNDKGEQVKLDAPAVADELPWRDNPAAARLVPPGGDGFEAARLTGEENADAMNQTSALLPRGQSEFEFAGLTPIPSETIRVPRVAEAPISYECKLQRIVTVSDEPGGGVSLLERGDERGNSRASFGWRIVV